MRSRRLPMSLEEYYLLPEHPGWKSEYWDGAVHLTPRHHGVVTIVPVAPRAIKAPYKLRPAVPQDAAKLVAPYTAAFSDTIEYCDATPQEVRQAARRALQAHFAGGRGEPMPGISQVAVEKTDAKTLLGAALIVELEQGPLLDLLFVAPAAHRRGVATALVAAVLNQLHRAGATRLASKYHIGNDESRAWHQRFGFIEEPDLTRARLYQMCARHELWRREELGDLPAKERAPLTAACEFWERQVQELEKIEDEQGYEAVHPMMRW